MSETKRAVLFRSGPDIPPVAGMVVREARDQRGEPWHGGPKEPVTLTGADSGFVFATDGTLCGLGAWSAGQLDILSPLPQSMRPADGDREAWAKFLPKDPLPNTGRKAFAVGQVWAYNESDSRPVVYAISGRGGDGFWPMVVIAGAWATRQLGDSSCMAEHSVLLFDAPAETVTKAETLAISGPPVKGAGPARLRAMVEDRRKIAIDGTEPASPCPACTTGVGVLDAKYDDLCNRCAAIADKHRPRPEDPCPVCRRGVRCDIHGGPAEPGPIPCTADRGDGYPCMADSIGADGLCQDHAPRERDAEHAPASAPRPCPPWCGHTQLEVEVSHPAVDVLDAHVDGRDTRLYCGRACLDAALVGPARVPHDFSDPYRIRVFFVGGRKAISRRCRYCWHEKATAGPYCFRAPVGAPTDVVGPGMDHVFRRGHDGRVRDERVSALEGHPWPDTELGDW